MHGFPIPLQTLDYLGVAVFAVTGALAAARSRHDVVTFAAFAILTGIGGTGERGAILAGIGARDAGALVERVADTLGAPVIKSLLGKMVIPDDSPYTTGGLGLLGTKASEELVEDIDTLLVAGTPEAAKMAYPAKLVAWLGEASRRARRRGKGHPPYQR